MAVWEIWPALQPDEPDRRGEPAGRQGHGDGGTAGFEAVHQKPPARPGAGRASDDSTMQSSRWWLTAVAEVPRLMRTGLPRTIHRRVRGGEGGSRTRRCLARIRHPVNP